VLPDELQDAKAFICTAAISSGDDQANANALIEYLLSAEAADLLTRRGMKDAGQF
jgi:hypothetical protein